MMNHVRTELRHEGQVLQLTLDAPPGNVLDRRMMRELTRGVEQAADSDRIKALVFQGSGEHFSYGASIEEHRKDTVGDMLEAFHTLLRTLIETARPSLAVVHGQCLGGGLELAAFCNWIFAHPDAHLGQPEIELALFPPAATLILPHRVGQSLADTLVLTGKPLSATEARAAGLVHTVSEHPAAAADRFLAERILPKSAIALHHALRASRHELHRAFLEGIAAVEQIYLDDLMASEDAREGLEAFIDKRPPVWKDR